MNHAANNGESMTFHYFERWNFLQDRPIDPLTEADARDRYDSGPWFSVALSSDPQFGERGVLPEALLEVEPKADAVKAYFFTPAGSVALVYWFRREGDRLFLAQTLQYHYDDEAKHRRSESVLTSTFSFSPDGSVTIRDDDKSQQTVQSSERSGVDVSSNWDVVPEFGAWRRLSRRERA